jgi:hypothetical protein
MPFAVHVQYSLSGSSESLVCARWCSLAECTAQFYGRQVCRGCLWPSDSRGALSATILSFLMHLRMQSFYSVLFSKSNLPFLPCHWADSVMCNFISQPSDDTWSSAGEWEKQQLEDIVFMLNHFVLLYSNTLEQRISGFHFHNTSEVWLLIFVCFIIILKYFKSMMYVFELGWNWVYK